jgi:hypothetical protein
MSLLLRKKNLTKWGLEGSSEEIIKPQRNKLGWKYIM